MGRGGARAPGRTQQNGALTGSDQGPEPPRDASRAAGEDEDKPPFRCDGCGLALDSVHSLLLHRNVDCSRGEPARFRSSRRAPAPRTRESRGLGALPGPTENSSKGMACATRA
ncbi:hypothetical protein MTO96_013886 [Rhipicephalus appendiculatus]